MKKLFGLLLTALLLFIVSCPNDDDNNTPKKKTYDEFIKGKPDAIWSEYLAYKYGKTFGWDAKNGLGDLKAPITHKMTAEEYIFAKGLNAGWNLGNTHDLTSNPRAATGNYDKLMPGVKAAGINVIRIPCTWGSNSTGEGALTGVNADFLDQVEAAVTAAHAGGLVVFINTHHDKIFFDLKRSGAELAGDLNGPGGPVLEAMTARFVSVWSQIAERFKDYGSWLIFEALNEPTITDNTGNTRWDGAEPEYHEVLNRWNQAFVTAVRDSGGNNAKRYLIFKSYAGKYMTANNPSNKFRTPTDPAGKGKLIYSFHSYVPQPLGLEGQGTGWSSSHNNTYRSMFATVSDMYIKEGIPVFMGETGATFHSRRVDADSVTANTNRLMLLNALGYWARQFGVIPCLWDNGEATRASGANNENGETFAMFRRKAAHDNDTGNWGKPIDHTRLAGGPNANAGGGTAMLSGNSAYNDPNFGQKTIQAFIDAVNGRTELGKPVMSQPATGN